MLNNGIESGGIDSYLINLIEHIDLTTINVDIFVPGAVTFEPVYLRFKKCNCELYIQGVTGGKIKKFFGLIVKLSQFLRTHQYDVIHINTGHPVRMITSLTIAKIAEVPCRIAHSHNTSDKEGYIKKLFYNLLRKEIVENATVLVGCSYAAAVTMFGEKSGHKAIVAPNGIDTKKFAFNQQTREQYRQKLGFDNCFVIGHVGRFEQQKNHYFLIETFKCIAERDTSARLLLIGEGPLENDIRALVNKYCLNDKVLFIGVTDVVEDYMCAMDVFVLPSLWEGFGIVNIEAQASGLPCIVSDVVPSEAKLTNLMEYISLEDRASVWADKILQYHPTRYQANREGAWLKVKDAGYDVSDTAQVIQNLYQGYFR